MACIIYETLFLNPINYITVVLWDTFAHGTDESRLNDKIKQKHAKF